MEDGTKQILDVVATYAGLLVAGVGFWYTLMTWRRGQAWQRAEKLDKLIEVFEASDLVQFACVLLDWSVRTTTFRGREVAFTTDDVLDALRTPSDFQGKPRMDFPGDQPLMREAFDALLSFLVRLQAALQSELIPRDATESYFSYWVKRLVWMDMHDPKGTGRPAKAALK